MIRRLAAALLIAAPLPIGPARAQQTYSEEPLPPVTAGPSASAPYPAPPDNPGPYGQTPYGQTPYGQTPYGQPSYTPAPAPAGPPPDNYGQGSYGQGGYGQGPYGQAPYTPTAPAPGGVTGATPAAPDVGAPAGPGTAAPAADQGSRVFCQQSVGYRLAERDGVPERYRRFLGIWSDAAWDLRTCAALIVQDVKPDGTASILYVFGPLESSMRGAGGILRGTGIIRNGELRFQNSDGSQFAFKPMLADLGGQWTTPQGQVFQATFKQTP